MLLALIILVSSKLQDKEIRNIYILVVSNFRLI